MFKNYNRIHSNEWSTDLAENLLITEYLLFLKNNQTKLTHLNFEALLNI